MRLEHVVHLSQPSGSGACASGSRSVFTDFTQSKHQVGHLWEGGRLHATGEKGRCRAPRQLPGPSLGVACGAGTHPKLASLPLMDRSDLLEAEQIPACPIAGFTPCSRRPSARRQRIP